MVDAAFAELADRLVGDVLLPGDADWDTARQAWNLAVDQRPVAIAYPESATDVAATVSAAAASGRRIAFKAGGHNAGPIDWSRDTILLKTERMREPSGGVLEDVQLRQEGHVVADRLQHVLVVLDHLRSHVDPQPLLVHERLIAFDDRLDR